MNNSLSERYKIIYFSRFQPKSDGDGGYRRTFQICKILEPYGYNFISSREYECLIGNRWTRKFTQSSIPVVRQLDVLYKNYITRCMYRKWSCCSRENLFNITFIAKTWRDNLIIPKNTKLVFIDDPVYLYPLVLHLNYLSIPIVALCHNIETLSQSQVIPNFQSELMSEELSILKKCRSVVTISREETFLLTNLGLDPIYLPYYPAGDVAKRMSINKEIRKSSRKKNFLMLGTVGNLPTLIGFENIIGCWQSLALPDRGDKLIVAGFGTEHLTRYNNNSIMVKGSISNEELDNFLREVKACIVFQLNGSGALTKICELLMAGVPVISNSHAARSYHNLRGIFEFTDMDDMKSLLQEWRFCDLETEVPVEPSAERLDSLLMQYVQ